MEGVVDEPDIIDKYNCFSLLVTEHLDYKMIVNMVVLAIRSIDCQLKSQSVYALWLI